MWGFAAQIDQTFGRHKRDQGAVADADTHHFQIIKDISKGVVGDLKPPVFTKHGKAVAHRLKRFPKLAFDDLHFFNGVAKAVQDVLLFVLDRRDLASGRTDFQRQVARMLAQPPVGGHEFGLFLFQPPFRSQTGAAFFREQFVQSRVILN